MRGDDDRAASGPAASTARDVRVLVVDDQSLVRAGFRTILDSEPGLHVVGEAADGGEAIRLARELAPDVVCMDVQMPGVDGLEATRRITADPGIPSAVLVLTTFNREDYLFEALAAGASGFLLKNSSPERLIEAVQVVAAGDALLSPDVTRAVIASASREARRAAAHETDGSHGTPSAASTARPSRPEELDALTEREREVLQLVASGMSNLEIASRLFLGEATVKTHVSKILMKLGVRDRIHAVVWAYEHGVVTPG